MVISHIVKATVVKVPRADLKPHCRKNNFLIKIIGLIVNVYTSDNVISIETSKADGDYVINPQHNVYVVTS